MPVLGASSLSDECERTGVDEVVATWAGDANDAAMQSATSVHNARRDGCCDGSWLNIVAVAGADTNAGIRRVPASIAVDALSAGRAARRAGRPRAVRKQGAAEGIKASTARAAIRLRQQFATSTGARQPDRDARSRAIAATCGGSWGPTAAPHESVPQSRRPARRARSQNAEPTRDGL